MTQITMGRNVQPAMAKPRFSGRRIVTKGEVEANKALLKNAYYLNRMLEESNLPLKVELTYPGIRVFPENERQKKLLAGMLRLAGASPHPKKPDYYKLKGSTVVIQTRAEYEEARERNKPLNRLKRFLAGLIQ